MNLMDDNLQSDLKDNYLTFQGCFGENEARQIISSLCPETKENFEIQINVKFRYCTKFTT